MTRFAEYQRPSIPILTSISYLQELRRRSRIFTNIDDTFLLTKQSSNDRSINRKMLISTVPPL